MPARPMWASPHKKRKSGSLPSTVEKRPDNTSGIYRAVWPFKKSVSQTQNRNQKKGFKKAGKRTYGINYGIPTGMPGTPNGTCVRDKGATCRCGGHFRQAA